MEGIVPRLLDAVVGNPILHDIVGADFFGTVGGTYLLLANSGMFFIRFFFLFLFELREKNAHRLFAVPPGFSGAANYDVVGLCVRRTMVSPC